MNHPVITVSNIGKRYTIKHQGSGYVALRDILSNVFKYAGNAIMNKIRGVSPSETKEHFWAVKNINFTLQKGEILGIIGHNGAGKSTLLKILSRITPPTTGEIRINGTVGSLLEVSTGFHPELTGRENIFLNGAILGMKKKEISAKFDRIVAFAGIEKFLDTPVKHYSSGMYVRLGFSVAVHMEPDVLIIDEVLAVGDETFQKQCLAKMRAIADSGDRAIIFISHNMAAVQDLCTRSILLSKGEIELAGPTAEVIERYKQDLAHEA
jgi:lipopolysaccharide transport system ATP-binding protein